MVRVMIRVISGYDLMLYMSAVVRIVLQSVMWKFSPTGKEFMVAKKRKAKSTTNSDFDA